MPFTLAFSTPWPHSTLLRAHARHGLIAPTPPAAWGVEGSTLSPFYRKQARSDL